MWHSRLRLWLSILRNFAAYTCVNLYHISDTVQHVIFKLNSAAGQPLYLQLMQQIRHAIETGVLDHGDVLPGIRTLAEELVVSPNTIAKAYSELEHEGLLDLRHGSGAYVTAGRRFKSRAERARTAQGRIGKLVEGLHDEGFSDEEIQRMLEAELFYEVSRERKP